MNKNNPTVYIVLTVYNGEKYFLEQLMSIYFQEYKNRFLIIVDDGSTDSSYNIAQKFVSDYNLGNKAKIIKQENKGTCKATERGLIEVQGLGKEDDYVTYCDADDIWCRNKLGYLVEYMESHKDCDLGFHDIAVLDQFGTIINNSFTKSLYYASPNDNSFFELAIQNHISINLIYKVALIKEIIPIENEGAKDHWTVLILSLSKKNIKFINKILGYYRRGHQSIQKTLYNNGIIRIYKRDLNLFKKLNRRFPNNKEIKYFVNYASDRIKRLEKGHSSKSLLLLYLYYPKRFFRIIKKIINYYF